MRSQLAWAGLAIALAAMNCSGSDPGPGGSSGATGAATGGAGGRGGRGGTGGSAPGGTGGTGGEATGGAGTGGSGTGGSSPATGGTTGGSPADAPRETPADAPGDSAGETPPPVAFDCQKLLGAQGPTSEWARPGGPGQPPLVYKALNAGGDQMMDFSHAGYRGGGVALPSPPAVQTLGPSGGDDTMPIQAALDAVAARPAGADGLRGAVLLRPGSYQLGGQLRLTASGVVLRGSGSGPGGTELRFTGAPRRVMFMTGTGTRTLEATSATIVDDHVPAGARSFRVDNPAAFKAGDDVMVGRPVTQAWIALLGMDKLVRNGAAQTWISAGSVLRGERQVTAVAGDRITVDVPLPDSLDGRYVKPPGGSLVKYTFPGRITQVGIEHFRAVGSPRAEANDFHFVELAAVKDGWVNDVVAHDFTSGVVVRDTVTRITVQDTLVSHTPVAYFTAAAPSDFNIDGSQVLINRGGSRGGNKIFYHSTAGGVWGPNVILGFTGSGMRSHIQPHQRWATGLLTDSTSLDDGNIEYINRGTAGSGHGWTMGWGVIWNSKSSTIRAEQPEGVANWAIGNVGTRAGNGVFDAHGTPVVPSSLYLAQLCARLGPAALAAVAPAAAN